jgi:tripartite-type tricarboxylate transporter receptor subunit TctC
MYKTMRWVALGLLALAALSAAAQDRFPSRSVEMIVPWGPGGGADVLGRVIARWLEGDLKATVPVINMAGATGLIGMSKLVSAPPDGHTIAVLTGDTALMLTAPATPVRMADLAVLGVMVRQPSGLFVRGDGRFRTWDDVVAEAKSKPGTVTVGTTGPNSPDEVTLDSLATKGIRLVSVGYARPGERYTAVLGGHVDLLYEQAGDIKGHLDSKALRPLLFFAPQRLGAPFADVPVSGEYGYDVLLPQFRAIVTRAGTDPKRLAVLAESLERFASSPEYATYLREQLALPDSFIPARGAQAFLEQELDAMQRVVSVAQRK